LLQAGAQPVSQPPTPVGKSLRPVISQSCAFRSSNSEKKETPIDLALAKLTLMSKMAMAMKVWRTGDLAGDQSARSLIQASKPWAV
jgi:hypothetical protein